ncbi:APC family permease [Mycolicibacterium sp. YH-1]|uniref:APC family permease n=1 Tax=Mycolicibacterium sp. YH-1 TaxID=2908837 RepID=UPI001F4C4A27|nr:APC family permease [Mycolicibacterium sp. YH-1]UNB55838.1 APC family permease [Mycolicibacterium sp. YH-1]
MSLTSSPVAVKQTQSKLGLSSLVLFGIAYMAPAVVLATFGIISEVSSGTSSGSYMLATVAMLLTAISYATMSARFALSGSAYSYVRKTLGAHTGFMAGWVLILDYFFLPMVIFLISGSFLSAQFEAVPFWVWIVAQVLIVSVVNVLGIRVADKANFLLLSFVALVLICFVALSLRTAASDGGASVLSPFWNMDSSLAGVAAGAAIACYSFLGFDAITTLTGEARDPRRLIPRAIVIATLAMGLIFTVVSFAAELVLPLTVVNDVDSAAFDIAAQAGGNLLSATIVAALVIGGFASSIAAQAGGSRLLLTMGRDGVLPKKFFGYRHPKLGTPVLNIALIGAVGLFATQMTLTTSTSFINFGAFTAFTAVNLGVLVLLLRDKESGPARWVRVLLAGAAIAITVYFLISLDTHAVTLGAGWLVAGLVYLVVLTRGFSRPPPEITSEAG